MKKMILVVDDDLGMLDLCKFALEGVGYDVTVALTGEIALELFKDHPDNFHAILIDYSMPGMNGVETAREIRKIRADIPFASFTGSNNEEVFDLLKQEKMDPILAKPFGLNTLIEVIEKKIGRADASQ